MLSLTLSPALPRASPPPHPPHPPTPCSYAEQATAFGRRLASPVFISTAPGGARCLGLSQIPVGRPLLLVGNHQTLALDLGESADGGGVLSRQAEGAAGSTPLHR